jgi:glycerol kinase
LNSFIVTIDQGSSATKVLAFDHQGHQSYRSFRSLKIERPRPGYVEQDPVHVLGETRAALEEVVSSIYADGKEILSIGLACQRSSFLLWDRKSGEPFTPIISWQQEGLPVVRCFSSRQTFSVYRFTILPLLMQQLWDVPF